MEQNKQKILDVTIIWSEALYLFYNSAWRH